ncbi:tenecin-1 [Agrilus planipennis]|uniref:Tenecin-1 n=1 Tax=Agrilus planipennis TaxID=224129 RepID=A0A1W4W7V8_AGRPL|nr:tenecin-1 [Agrilus planipennis]
MLMKLLAAVVVVCILIEANNGAPVEEIEEGVHTAQVIRTKRATCDLLSVQAFGASVGHSACAAHCLAMRGGRKGGYCSSKGVCICRF